MDFFLDSYLGVIAGVGVVFFAYFTYDWLQSKRKNRNKRVA
jgi:hypothetical protein